MDSPACMRLMTVRARGASADTTPTVVRLVCVETSDRDRGISHAEGGRPVSQIGPQRLHRPDDHSRPHDHLTAFAHERLRDVFQEDMRRSASSPCSRSPRVRRTTTIRVGPAVVQSPATSLVCVRQPRVRACGYSTHGTKAAYAHEYLRTEGHLEVAEDRGDRADSRRKR